jgi:hypothetical protein
MSFNYLKEEEKVRSLIYTTNHEVAKFFSDMIIEKKQWEMLNVLWKYYIKESDYSYIVRAFRTNKFNVVYTYVWPEKMSLINLDILLGELIHRTEQDKKIHIVLHEEYSKGRYTYAHEKLVLMLRYLHVVICTIGNTDLMTLYLLNC